MKKIQIFMKRYNENRLQKNIIDRCCDFSLLEKVYNEYKK